MKKPHAFILLYPQAFIEVEGNKAHVPGAFETDVELSLSTPRSYIGAAKIQLHSYLTSAFDGVGLRHAPTA